VGGVEGPRVEDQDAGPADQEEDQAAGPCVILTRVVRVLSATKDQTDQDKQDLSVPARGDTLAMLW